MNYGSLRCLGTQTRLKTKFGSGYQLQFHCEKGRGQEVREFVEAELPKAIHTETYAGKRRILTNTSQNLFLCFLPYLPLSLSLSLSLRSCLL